MWLVIDIGVEELIAVPYCIVLVIRMANNEANNMGDSRYISAVVIGSVPRGPIPTRDWIAHERWVQSSISDEEHGLDSRGEDGPYFRISLGTYPAGSLLFTCSGWIRGFPHEQSHSHWLVNLPPTQHMN